MDGKLKNSNLSLRKHDTSNETFFTSALGNSTSEVRSTAIALIESLEFPIEQPINNDNESISKGQNDSVVSADNQTKNNVSSVFKAEPKTSSTFKNVNSHSKVSAGDDWENIGVDIHKQKESNDRQEMIEKLRKKILANQSVNDPAPRKKKAKVYAAPQKIVAKSPQSLDIIVSYIVLDTYIFGFLFSILSFMEVVLGFMYIDECTVNPLIPFMCIVNGGLNILNIYCRYLSNIGRLDYSVMSMIRLFAFYSFLFLFVLILSVAPSYIIWFKPGNDVYYRSVDGIYYCNGTFFTIIYFISLISCILILLLTLYGIFCNFFVQRLSF